MKKSGAIEFARRAVVILLFVALGVFFSETPAEINPGLEGTS